MSEPIGELAARAPLRALLWSAADQDVLRQVETLYDAAMAYDASTVRLAEGHLDALTILLEAGVRPQPGVLYGVWASRGTLSVHDGVVTGSKPFCSGLGIVDRALVTATQPGEPGLWLLDVPVRADRHVHHDLSGWATAAMVRSRTGVMTLAQLPVDRCTPLGESDFYLARPGFWPGALRPAACWTGLATATVRDGSGYATRSPRAEWDVVEAFAEARTALAVLRDAARRYSEGDRTTTTATVARHAIERSCARLLDAVERGLGPRPFVHDGVLAQRIADLRLYLRQSEGLGGLTVEDLRGSWFPGAR